MADPGTSGFRHPKPASIPSLNRGIWDRFGLAIASQYATPVSSKAADYELKRHGGKADWWRTRRVTVARVAMGRSQTLYKDDPQGRTFASRGFDSIIAPPGAKLNYTEHATYKDGAAVPLFV
ncbi:hypothetical protein OC834_001896 [Tilletia horrida]|nr:hypothetical protein OC834_001896 [Tilletia horrida]